MADLLSMMMDLFSTEEPPEVLGRRIQQSLQVILAGLELSTLLSEALGDRVQVTLIDQRSSCFGGVHRTGPVQTTRDHRLRKAAAYAVTHRGRR